MFGMKKTGVSAYTNVGLETGVVDASPLKLTIMLYEGAITACIQAKQAIAQQDIEQKSHLLNKATSIIESGLRASLNKQAGGGIALQLDELYQYMVFRLMKANSTLDNHIIDEIQQLLMELKSAWISLLNQSTHTVAPAVNGQMSLPRAPVALGAFSMAGI